MKEIRIRLLSILFHSELHGVRFLLGLAEVVWGITLLMPGDTFGRPTYAVMAAVAKEEVWACIMVVTAFLQFCILIRQKYHTRRAVIFAAYNSTLWWYLVVSMYMSVTPPPAAISGEFALAVGAAWVFVRSGMPTFNNRKFQRRRDEREIAWPLKTT